MDTTYERYKREIYRIGWRLQYRAKKIRSRESSFYNTEPVSPNSFASVEDKIILEQLRNTLPAKGKWIIDRLYLQGQTEAEVSRQLNISQQAVGQWKKKNDKAVISDGELLKLIAAARLSDQAAMTKLLELYKEDILYVSQFIHMPTDDAVSAITVEFLESVLHSD